MKNMLCLCSAFKESMVAGCLNGANHYAQFDSNASSSETMMIHIDKLLCATNLTLASIEQIAVVVGPGSFTGIRIALALVKGFALAHPNVKLIAVSTLQMLAWKAAKQFSDHNILATMDGLSGNFFVCQFDASLQSFGAEMCLKQAEFKQMQKNSDIMVYAAQEIAVEGAIPIKLDAADLLEFSKLLASKNQFTTNQALLPNYLRLSQAEEALLEKQKLALRAAEQSDAKALHALSLLSFGADSASQAMILDELSNPSKVTFVAEQNGALVGFLTAMMLSGECELLNIATHPNLMQQGIGSKLLLHLLEHCQQNHCQQLFLEVRESNQNAIKLYTKFGFEVIGRRKHYYSSGEDAILLKKTINN